jgi:hypothetical protein
MHRVIRRRDLTPSPGGTLTVEHHLHPLLGADDHGVVAVVSATRPSIGPVRNTLKED